MLSKQKGWWREPWRLSLLFAVLIPFFSDFSTPVWAVASLVAALCDARRRGASLSAGPAGQLLILYLAFILLGLIYARDRFTSLGVVLMWLILYLPYLAVTTVLCNRERLKTALTMLAAVTGMIGLIGAVQYLLAGPLALPVPIQLWQAVDKAVYALFPVDFILNINGIRPAATFNNPNVCAEYLFMVFPFLLCAVFSKLYGPFLRGPSVQPPSLHRSRMRRTFFFVCAAAAAAGLAVTFSRGSYLALLAVIGVFCVFYPRKWPLYLLAAAAVLLMLPDAVIGRFLSIGAIDNSIAERLSVWKVGFDSIAQHPLIGIGPGTYNTWYLLRDAGINAPHMHNLFLQLLTEGGIIGFTLMGTVIAWVFRDGVRLIRSARPGQPRYRPELRSEQRMLGVALIAFVAGLLVDGLVDFPLLTPRLVGTFTLVLALADASGHLYRGEQVHALRRLLPGGKPRTATGKGGERL